MGSTPATQVLVLRQSLVRAAVFDGDTVCEFSWPAQRCEEWGIECEEPKETLLRLAERSQQVPGMALQVLNKAHKRRSKLLTRSIVENHVFDFDD